jgi:hypothetical protein
MIRRLPFFTDLFSSGSFSFDLGPSLAEWTNGVASWSPSHGRSDGELRADLSADMMSLFLTLIPLQLFEDPSDRRFTQLLCCCVGLFSILKTTLLPGTRIRMSASFLLES